MAETRKGATVSTLNPFSPKRLARIKAGKEKLGGNSTLKIDVEAIRAKQSAMSKKVREALFGKPAPVKKGPEAITYPMAEKMADAAFSTWKRMQAADADGNVHCFLCGKRMKWQRAVLMHFQSRTAIALQWDETANQVGCSDCNGKDNGDRPAFAAKLDEVYGPGTSNRLYVKSKKALKIPTNDLLVKARWYRERIAHIKEQREKGIDEAHGHLHTRPE